MTKSKECIFCKIIAQEVPAEVIMDTKDVLVIKDIAPKAPIHYLIITKKHINDIPSIATQDISCVSEIMLVVQQLAHNLEGSKSFQIISNNGHEAGQSVFHLHFHFLSGTNIFNI